MIPRTRAYRYNLCLKAKNLRFFLSFFFFEIIIYECDNILIKTVITLMCVAVIIVKEKIIHNDVKSLCKYSKIVLFYSYNDYFTYAY